MKKSVALMLLANLSVGACNQGPETITFSGKDATSADEDSKRHGPDPDSINARPDDRTSTPGPQAAVPTYSTPQSTTPVATPIPAPIASPTPIPAPPPAVTPPPAPELMPIPAPTPVLKSAADLQKEKYMAMLATKKLVSEYTVTNAKGWGTSSSNPIQLLTAVDESGKAIVPNGTKEQQIKGDVDPANDDRFLMKNGSAVNSMHSVLRVCNKSDKGIYMHAEDSSPFEHGNDSIMPGGCGLFLINKSGDMKEGDIYDHAAGGDKSNFIYYQTIKIKPDGSTM